MFKCLTAIYLLLIHEAFYKLVRGTSSINTKIKPPQSWLEERFPKLRITIAQWCNPTSGWYQHEGMAHLQQLSMSCEPCVASLFSLPVS